ncbi:MAG: hypothetical protein ACR2GF_06310 [Acidimicrobiales bacterium]
MTDSLILSSRVDATLLTCLAGVTTRKEVSRAAELLRQVDAPLAGTILNGVSEGQPYGYYYRNYGASTGPASADMTISVPPANGNGSTLKSRFGSKASRHQP